jgi:O-antigen/teichoic acid export membrane protein
VGAGQPSDGTTVGRISRALGAHVGGMGISVLVQLVSVPVLLSGWGVSTYGEWLVLSAVPTYVALSDLSLSSVAGNSMVMLRASGRHADAVLLGRRLWPIVTATSGLTVLAAMLIALAATFWLSDSPIPRREAFVVLIALFADVAIGIQMGVLDAWYRSAGRYPTSASLRQGTRLLENAALMVSVLLGAGPGTAAVAYLAGGAAGMSISFLVLRRVVPWSAFPLGRPHGPTVRELAPGGMAFAAFPIGNALSVQGFTIVIGATLGATAVVVFSTTRTLTRLVLQAMASINAAIAPELSRAVGAGDLREARTILGHAVQLSIGLAAAIVVALVLIGPRAIEWWTRGLIKPDVSLLDVLLVGMVANSIWYTLSAALIATNNHVQLARLYLTGTAAALAVSIPLGQLLGVAGAAAALLAIDATLTVYVLRASARLLHETPAQLIRAVLRRPEKLRRDAPTI